MPGKRPRPIRRTTSVSQLSSGLDPSPIGEERLAHPVLSALAPQQVAHSNNQNPALLSFGTERAAVVAALRQDPALESHRMFPVNAPDDESIGGNADESLGCEMMQNGLSMMWVEDNPDAQSMAIDGVNESRSFSPPERSARRLQSVHSPSNTLSSARSEPSELKRPVDYLDICFYCKRRLRFGRDIFMYRGDRFCSIECRCHQMAADEWREKCTVTAARKGGASPAVSSNTTNQLRPTETAAAA